MLLRGKKDEIKGLYMLSMHIVLNDVGKGKDKIVVEFPCQMNGRLVEKSYKYSMKTCIKWMYLFC